MTIRILDSKRIINDAATLLQDVVELESTKQSLEYILNEIKEYWEQTQEDAAYFYEELKNNIEVLSKILNHNKEFANAITDYAESQTKTSEKTIN